MSKLARLLRVLILARERCASAIARSVIEAIESGEPWLIEEAMSFLRGEAIDHSEVAERYLGDRSRDSVERVRRSYREFLKRISTSCPSRRVAYDVGLRVLDEVMRTLEELDYGEPLDKALQSLLRGIGRVVNGAEDR